jgi:hypothetical protein
MILYCTQLSVPTKISQTDCPHRFPTVCVDDMFVTQLSVPAMVAQTVEPQRRPTVCANTGGTDSCTTNTSTTHHKQIVDPRRQQQQTTKTSTANLNYCTLLYSTLIYSTLFYFTSALCYSTVHDCLCQQKCFKQIAHIDSQLSVLITFWWPNCLCHQWWHRQLVHKDINSRPQRHQRPTYI